MTVGSSMLATIRTAPPQWTQVLMSMPNTRLMRCAHVNARRFSSGGAVIGVGVDVSRCGIGDKPFAAPRWRQLRAQVRVRRKDAVKPGEVGALWRHQRRQLGDEVHGFPFDMAGAVRPLRGNARCARCAFTRCARSVGHGVLSSYRTLPCGGIEKRFCEIAGRAM